MQEFQGDTAVEPVRGPSKHQYVLVFDPRRAALEAMPQARRQARFEAVLAEPRNFRNGAWRLGRVIPYLDLVDDERLALVERRLEQLEPTKPSEAKEVARLRVAVETRTPHIKPERGTV